MYTCRICEESAVATDQGVCARCMNTVGARPLPPARRAPIPCTRCNHLQFVRVVPREISAGSDPSQRVAGPMGLGHPHTSVDHQTLFSGRQRIVTPPSATDARAIIEAYVCTRCGFIDWYCQNPDEIPLGPEHMAELIEYGSDQPYR